MILLQIAKVNFLVGIITALGGLWIFHLQNKCLRRDYRSIPCKGIKTKPITINKILQRLQFLLNGMVGVNKIFKVLITSLHQIKCNIGNKRN